MFNVKKLHHLFYPIKFRIASKVASENQIKVKTIHFTLRESGKKSTIPIISYSYGTEM